MSDELEELKRRLVVGHKCDGRSVYDSAAKAELVALCKRPGASVSRLARDCGVNANQVSRWVRESAQEHRGEAVAGKIAAPTAFVAVPVLPPLTRATAHEQAAAALSLQAHLPNGVTVDLRGLDRNGLREVVESVGRLRCFVSTKA